MRVRMTTTLAGINVVYAAGEEYEFDDAYASRLIEAGFAVPLVETSAARPRRRRGGELAESADTTPREER